MKYHILNGDSLKEQFPESIPGDIIVCRECLVDGDVNGENLEELYKTRIGFLSLEYDGVNEQGYFIKTVSEFEKIKAIPKNSEINLWFEDDLFCQVNLWFVLFLIKEYKLTGKIFLIRPSTALEYGFGGMGEADLIEAFHNKNEITPNEFEKLSKFWNLYKYSKHREMLEITSGLNSDYSFLIQAIKANKERFPEEGKPGRPIESLLNIMKELNTDEFGPVFREFSKRESIYGFGDLQVKRLYDQVKNNREI